MRHFITRAAGLLATVLLPLMSSAAAAPGDDGPWHGLGFTPLYPTEGAPMPRTRSGPTGSKLTEELESIYVQLVAEPDGEHLYTPQQLRDLFGIDADAAEPRVALFIRLAEGADPAALERAGADVHVRHGDLVSISAPVHRLRRLGLDPAVAAIELGERLILPAPPGTMQQWTPTTAMRSSGPPDLGYTGRGVLIGIIDSGIDFRHPDFIDEKGESRIAALYDVYDNMHSISGGSIGLPGSHIENGVAMGTIYTRLDLNKALRGELNIPSRDRIGHGTAVAGIAAGGGRATSTDADPARYRGIAPDARLIVVNVNPPGEGGVMASAAALAEWIVTVAKHNNMPVVINMSFGNHRNPHDGSDIHEQILDRIAGPGIPGVALVVAAGNEGEQSFHAAGRFGPRRPGQQDVDGTNIELFVTQPALLDAYFHRGDDWGLGIAGLQGALTDAEGKPQQFLFISNDGNIGVASSPNLSEADRSAFAASAGVHAHNAIGNNQQRVSLTLPPGRYIVWGFGMPNRFEDGRFALYLPQTGAASFGRGAERRHMVGTPGNASHAITVGSYDFRARWQTTGGEWVGYNLELGALSRYSSPGFRRDGRIKPDIVAPGQWSISALAKDSAMGVGAGAKLADTGQHIIWNGTSAAAPYTAGVIALMLQKNPTLDAVQILDILRETAIQDEHTGTLPNPQWGYGRLNPVMAIRRTPEAEKAASGK
jgi:subtilisin family serine protease